MGYRGLRGLKAEYSIIASSFLIMLVVCGSWFSFPVYINTFIEDFNWDRSSISSVISLGLIVSGLALPFIGRSVDRFGPKRVIFIAGILLGVSLILKSAVRNIWELTFFHSVIGALGYAGSSLVANTALISRLVSKRRVIAMSLSQSGLPLGQQLFVPLAAYLTIIYDWRISNILLGTSCLILVPTLLSLIRSDEHVLLNESTEQDTPSVLIHLKNLNYLLLLLLYFCCGFTDIAIASHFILFSSGIGISEFLSASFYGLIGGLTWIGTVVCGFIAGKLGRDNLMVGIYSIRSLSIVLLLFTNDVYTVVLFLVLFGLTYFSMVPLISSRVEETYGRPYLGRLFATLSLVHAVGASVGTYLYGLLFDIQGDYSLAFTLALLVSLVATLGAAIIRKRG